MPMNHVSLLQRVLLGCYSLVDRTGLLKTGPGRKMQRSVYFFYKRHYETNMVNHLRKQINSQGLFIDVGANIGFYSDLFARWGGKNCHILAIEPDPRNLIFLEDLAKTKPTLSLIPAAVGDSDGQEGILILDPRNPMNNHLGVGQKENQGVTVPVKSVDAIVQDFMASPQPGASLQSLPVVLIKIDVQGGELPVLRGAAQTVQKWQPALFVEIDPWLSKDGADKVLDWIYDHDYLGALPPLFAAPVTAKDILEKAKAEGYIDVLFRHRSHFES